MHRNGYVPPEWGEVDQLCGSQPFQAFCRSSLPSADQRLVCQACRQQQQSRCRSEAPQRHLEYLEEPEAHWQQHSLPAWTAPYVWETNYL